MCLSLFGGSILRNHHILKLCKNWFVFICSGVKFLAQMFFSNKTVVGHPESLMDGENSSLHEICCGPQPIRTSSNPKDRDSQHLHKFPKHLLGGLALRTSDLMETFMLLFFPLGFCYYKQSSKEHPYIFSLVHMSEKVFSERYIPKSLQLRCPHRLSGVGSVTSLQDGSLSSTFSASQGTPSPGSELILIHWENAEPWPPLHLRKDSPSTGSAALTCPSFLKT